MGKGLHLFFSGAVQGVGFRFSAVALAKQHNLKGWVKNLRDGRVELMLQGSPKNLNLFLEGINQEFKRGIADCQIEELESGENLADFKIVF